MPNTSKDVLGAALVGVVVSGVIGALLDTVSFAWSFAVGAIAGGAVAGYVLYGQIPDGAKAGALAGAVGAPFYFGLSEVLYVFGAIPPQSTTPPMSEIQAAIGIIFISSLFLGSIGGVIGSATHHREPQQIPAQPTVPGVAPGQVRYCVQCGAQLPAGSVVCPHCNARQPV